MIDSTADFYLMENPEEGLRLKLRGLENTKIPFIMFSYYNQGGFAYENTDISTKWSIS